MRLQHELELKLELSLAKVSRFQNFIVPTQPQHNLTLVGFDMIIAVHTTTTPPTGNSTSIECSIRSTFGVA